MKGKLQTKCKICGEECLTQKLLIDHLVRVHGYIVEQLEAMIK